MVTSPSRPALDLLIRNINDGDETETVGLSRHSSLNTGSFSRRQPENQLFLLPSSVPVNAVACCCVCVEAHVEGPHASDEGYTHLSHDRDPADGGIWNDKRTAELIHRWNVLAETSGTIATALGVPREAICSKVHRLRKKGVPMAQRLGPGSIRPRKRNPAMLAFPQHSAPKAKSTASDSVPAPPAKGRPVRGAAAAILDLKPDQCRWPIGDTQSKDFHFCSSTKLPLHSYCEAHARLAVQPPRKRISDEAADPAPVAYEATPTMSTEPA